MEVNRRTQAERSATTRAALVSAGRKLFAAKGFGAVGTPAIVAEAGVTRGALYHQFEDKTDLFAAVFDEVEQEVTARMAEIVAASGVTDPMTALITAADAWFDISSEPEVHRIVLIEAPAALGWTRWRELGIKYTLGMTEQLLAAAIAAGSIRDQPVRPLAHVLIGAIDEAALYIASSADPDTARAEMRHIVRQLIDGMARDAKIS
jgi:AcrR family transcriptional regulator